MIQTIRLETCTGCGICDFVCPADVIHMEPVPSEPSVPDLAEARWLPVIKHMEHCITCFSCEILCPDGCIDVFPIVKARPLPW